MIYFDNAATAFPKKSTVGTAMCESLKLCGNPGRAGHSLAIKAAETVYQCRKRLAGLFNTRPENVILTSGATEALNIAIKGANRKGGVTAVSSMEHNSVMRPVNALRKSGETVMRQFLVNIKSDLITLDNFSAVCASATNVVITHASNVCGRILPVKQLREIAPEEAIFVLDASQTAGHIPIDIVGLGVDIICIPAHKGFCGPFGVGALIVNPYSDIQFETILEGGTGTNSKSLEMPELLPERLEFGTANVCGIAGFSEALKDFEYPENEGRLFSLAVKELRSMVDITLHGAPEGENLEGYVPVILFNKKGFDCETLCALLADRGFALRAGYHCAPNAHRTLGTGDFGGVRLSLGRFNTQREVERFIKALSQIKGRA